MTLANPTTEPVEVARAALSVAEHLSVPDALALIRDVRSLCTATETRVLARQIDAGVGSHQIRQVIKDTTGNSNREASQAVRRAEALNQLPEVVAKMEAGKLSTGQIDLIVKAVNETSVEAVAGSDIIERITEATVDQGGRTVKDWIVDQQDPDQLRNRHDRLKARREAAVRRCAPL